MRDNIDQTELEELRRKASLYDALAARRSAGGKISSSKLTPEERSIRAKKAVQARIDKRVKKS